MAENSKILCDNLAARKALFEMLGGLPETAVQNAEWLYMLEEETRNSVAVEGYFATEVELRAVLMLASAGLVDGGDDSPEG